METSRSLGLKHAPRFLPDLSDWDDQFDHDGWNLRTIIVSLLSKIDGRVGLLSKQDLDRIVDLTTHLRDWKNDARLVADPATEHRFVLDAASLLSMLDEPAFDDVPKDGKRDFAAECLETVTARLQAIVHFEDDRELQGFAF